MPTSVAGSKVASATESRKSTTKLIAAVVVGAALGIIASALFGRIALGAGLGAVAGIAVGAVLTRDPLAPTLNKTGVGELDALKAYTDGKMQRYKLLFAVNGGAFAVGQFVLGAGASRMAAVLPIQYLADGAIIYTALMTVDIWLYGQMMRARFVGDAAFTPAGKALLVLVSTLLIGGWFLVSLTASQAGG